MSDNSAVLLVSSYTFSDNSAVMERSEKVYFEVPRSTYLSEALCG